MKNTTANNTSKTRIIVLLVMMLLSGVGMFGQTATTAANFSIGIEVAAADSNATTAIEANPNLNMVSWFMGTKQTPNAAISKDGINKKQMINSGIAPNRLLIKAFLKKANEFQNAVA